MEHTEFVPIIGAIYSQDVAHLRVVAVEEGHALLEQWVGDCLNQYIVASRFFLHEGELHWRGNGSYFLCKYPPPVCDMPIDALRKALIFMREPRDEEPASKQEAYCQYLHGWAELHVGAEYQGMTPACFEEWDCSEDRMA